MKEYTIHLFNPVYALQCWYYTASVYTARVCACTYTMHTRLVFTLRAFVRTRTCAQTASAYTVHVCVCTYKAHTLL